METFTLGQGMVPSDGEMPKWQLLCAMETSAIPYYLSLGNLSIGLIIFQFPTLLNLITLNGVIHGGDDHRAQKRLRIALATGLIGYVLSVGIA
mgnify:CR=1 FL=1